VKERVHVPAGTLCLVERQIGAPQKLLAVDACRRDEGHPDARTDVQELAFHDVRPPQQVDDPAGEVRDIVGRSIAQEEHAELVPAQSVDSQTVALEGAQTARDSDEKSVSDRVSQGVVDGFEAIEVDGKKGDFARPARRSEPAFGIRDQLLAIAKRGERVRASGGFEQISLVLVGGDVRSDNKEPVVQGFEPHRNRATRCAS
jgi:hypothetical protein